MLELVEMQLNFAVDFSDSVQSVIKALCSFLDDLVKNQEYTKGETMGERAKERELQRE